MGIAKARGWSRPLFLIAVFGFSGMLVGSLTQGCGSDGAAGDGASSGANADASSGGTSGVGASGGGTSGGGTSGGGTSGVGASGGGTSGGGTSGGDLPDVQFIYVPPDRDGALNGDSACAQTSAAASLQPLDLFITLDHTASMKDPDPPGDCDVGTTTVHSKWCNAINALSSYFNSAASTGNGAALNFFNVNTQCDGTGLDTSVVPGGTTGYTTLPSTAFDSHLNSDSPTGGFGTLTEAAIRGLTAFTSRAANRRAGRTTIGVIVTDGDPTACDTNNTHLSNLLQTHFTNTTIRTFLIGMTGANDATLEAIATGGNAATHATNIGGLTNTCGSSASPCRHWNVGDGNGAVLAQALQEIQKAAIGCTYTMPTTSVGVINPNAVSVQYWPGGVEASAAALVKVDNQAACVANGWYYDNNAAPTNISLCAAECTTVQADPNARVQVYLGCLGG